ncbi:MFS transporter [Lactococcus hircilactis]|uniref:MFS transporter n=1 Tax=Lactococcus hircilactis TaxID=1494462 RepID=UPI003FA2CDAE
MKKIEKKNASVLITSSSISRAGDILFDYASNTFLASINRHSLMLVGIYQTLENMISVIFNLFGGVIADRFRRKRILILTDFFSGLTCLVAALINVSHILIFAIIGGTVVLSLLSSFSNPAYKAITKESVEKETIAELNSNLQTASMIMKIVIPLVSVGIYHIIGIHGALALDAVSFFVSASIVLLISPIIEEVKKREKFSFSLIFKDLASGFTYLFHKKRIFILIILAAFVNFFLAAYNLLLPFGNQMFPKIIGNIYGSYLTAEAVGGIIGAVISGKINKKMDVNQLMLYLGISGISLGLAPVFYHIYPTLYLLVLSPALFNLFLALFNIQFFSFVQREVESEFLGRVFGIIFTVAILFMPLGTLLFTLLLTPSFEYNFLFVGMGILILSILFTKIYQKYA